MSTQGQGGERTPEAIARKLMLTHTFCFPADMASVEETLRQRFQTTGTVVIAAIERLEFEIVEAIKDAIESAPPTPNGGDHG